MGRLEIALPEGYSFVYGTDIDPQQILQLHRKNGHEYDDADMWQNCLQESRAVVGVLHQQVLVGVGFLAGNSRHAVFCDLEVDHEHGGKGLGRALVRERMRIADEQRIKYLYTDLADTNPLRSLYEELGFTNTGNSLFRKKLEWIP